MGIELIKLASR